MSSTAGTSPDDGVDLLRLPGLGAFLRWRHARTTLQLILLLVAAVVVLHGLLGTDLASANLATVLTWVHYRGLLIIGLLAIGNVFCTGCPFILVRDWGRRVHRPARRWPAWLRGKWLALLMMVAVLFVYELFDLWALPRATALLVVGYFVAALAIDLTFAGGSFCKHACPIGQFSFVAAALSPFEVRVRHANTCTTCTTADCIAGRHQEANPRAPLVQRGCELGLFLPQKVGNLDCTFCLDCVQACPHDNVAVASRVPGLELAEAGRRSGIGRLPGRPDIAAFVVVFVFGALVNAVAMVSPARQVEARLAVLGLTQTPLVLAALFVIGLVVLPAALLGTAAIATRALARDADAGVAPRSLAAVIQTYVHGLVPLGCGLWLAHYGFHLLTGLLTVVPVAQSAVIDAMGWPLLGEPLWRAAGMRPGAVFPIQLGCVLLGALGSAGVIGRLAKREHPDAWGRVAASWLVVTCVVAAAAIWIMAQPMEMRGLGGVG